MQTSSFLHVCTVVVCAVAIGALGSRPAAQSPATPVAVVVNRSVTVSSITASHLRDILLGERQHWPGRRRIVVLRPGDGPVWSAVLGQLLRMPADAYARAIAASQYRGFIVEGPRVVEPAASLRRLVAQTPGAIGLLPASELDPSVTVLKIDDRGPDDPGYVLAGR